MLILGVVFLGVGSIGLVAAVILEIKYKEPKYKIFMKVFPWFLGIGGIMVAMGV